LINKKLFLIKDLIKKNKELIKFLIFGSITTLINLIAFFLLSKIIQNIFFMTIIYWFLGLNLKFFIYKNFVFNDYKYIKLINKILKHYAFYTTIFFVNYFFLDFCSKNYSLDLVLFQFAFIILGVPISYLFLKNKVFK
jgi:putative flippase GtrA